MFLTIRAHDIPKHLHLPEMKQLGQKEHGFNIRRGHVDPKEEMYSYELSDKFIEDILASAKAPLNFQDALIHAMVLAKPEDETRLSLQWPAEMLTIHMRKIDKSFHSDIFRSKYDMLNEKLKVQVLQPNSSGVFYGFSNV